MSIYFNGNFIDTAVSVVSVEISSGGGTTLPDLSAITNYPALIDISSKILFDLTEVTSPTSSLSFDSLSAIDLGDQIKLNSNYITAYSFPKLSSLSVQNSFLKAAYNNKIIKHVDFPALSVLKYGVYNMFSNAFYYSAISSANFPKLVSIPNSGFINGFSYSDLISVNFDSLKTVFSQGFMYGFNNSKLTSVSFPQLSGFGNSNESYSFHKAFLGCNNLSFAEFPELLETGVDTFSEVFRYCYNLSSISFPKLSVIRRYAFNTSFDGCTSLISVDFSAVSVFEDGAQQAFQNTFNNCVNLKLIDFNNLTSLPSDSQFLFLWNNNDYPTKTQLSIKFSNLQSIDGNNVFGTYPYSGQPNLVNVLDFTGQQSIPDCGDSVFTGDTQLTAVVPNDLYWSWIDTPYWSNAIQNGYINISSQNDWENQ